MLGQDQATKLRKLVAQQKQARSARIIAVASGKGGVGKTAVAVNLATSLAAKGRRVVLFDADLGLANAEVLLNVDPAVHRAGCPGWPQDACVRSSPRPPAASA